MQQKHTMLTTSLLMLFTGALATTGDEGYYDSWGKARSKTESIPATSVKRPISVEPIRSQINTLIYVQPIPEHIITLKIRAGKAIKSDRLTEFKRIILHSDLKKYPNACENLFNKIVSHWTRLRNGKAYLVRLEKQVGYLPQLTEKMLCKQLAYTCSSHSQKKILQQISRLTTFLALAKNMKINDQPHSVLEYLQFITKEAITVSLDEYSDDDEYIRSRDRKIIFQLYTTLEIPGNPFDPKESRQ